VFAHAADPDLPQTMAPPSPGSTKIAGEASPLVGGGWLTAERAPFNESE
jgi:hypothetical protein